MPDNMVLLLGVVLVAAAIGVTVDIFVQNTEQFDLDAFGRTFAVTPGWLVVTGIAVVVVFLIGARLIALGVARARRRRRALRTGLAASQERDRLAQQLADERAEHQPHGMAQGEPLEGSSSAPVPAPIPPADVTEAEGKPAPASS